MYTLFKKEFNQFFSSLIGYLVIGLFLIANSLFLWIFPGDYNLLDNGYASLAPMFYFAPWIFLFLIPAITMRMFSDEKNTGTIELLFTKPISDFQIILAKYFAALSLVIFSLIPVFVYYLSVWYLSNPVGNLDQGAFWGSYIGLVLLAAVYVAIGIFGSSLTKNQIVAFIISMTLTYIVYIGFDSIGFLSIFKGFENQVIALGIAEHYRSISRGVIDSRDVLYFLSIVTLFISLTKLKLDARKF
ncbi:MAG: gliding motility-associated ABC transporter permease subunit GldF [Bacteroidales bacterium]|nr:gliding motility-associated ABC transporter permease subunit GldF [Bacteroidales bacterium]